MLISPFLLPEKGFRVSIFELWQYQDTTWRKASRKGAEATLPLSPKNWQNVHIAVAKPRLTLSASFAAITKEEKW